MKKLFLITLTLTSLNMFSQEKFDPISLDNMDQTVRPQDDFYNFVNGNWMKTAEIPSDRARWGSFDELREKTDINSLSLLKSLLEKEFPKGSDEQKIRDLYNSYIDFDARDKTGIAPILPYLKEIDKIKNVEELQSFFTEYTPLGLNFLYPIRIGTHMKNSNKNTVYLGAANLSLGRAYFQKEDDANKEALGQLSDYIDKLNNISGQKSRDLKGPKIVGFQKNVSKTLLNIEQIRDSKLRFNPFAVKDLQKLSKNVDLAKYISDLGVKTDSVIIGELRYFQSLDSIVNEKNLPIIKDYLKFSIVNNASEILTKELDQANFEFYNKQLRGQKEQRALDKRGLEYVNGNVGELLGKLYVKEFFPPEAKSNAEELIQYLIKSFDVHIKNLQWMSEDTKVKALDKLHKFTVKTGYPDKWKDYSNLEIVSSSTHAALWENALAIKKWRYNDMMDKFGKPVDKTEWGMNPQTVNAYYSSSNNEIVFPAAILQSPFYDFRADAAVNFGGIGAVIGHEISHGFDDSGAQYDGNGNLVNWWTDIDNKKFTEVGNALADQYSKYEPVKGSFVNGKYTLGENIGDLGGINVAYDALEMYLKDKGNPGKIDGFTPQQRFFISWATIWRTKSTEEALKNQVKTDSHSPGYFRAVGPLENMDSFYKAFDVQEGDKMYKTKNQRILIW